VSTQPANINQPEVRVVPLGQLKKDFQMARYKPYLDKALEAPEGHGVEVEFNTRYMARQTAARLRCLILSLTAPVKVSQIGKLVKLWKI